MQKAADIGCGHPKQSPLHSERLDVDYWDLHPRDHVEIKVCDLRHKLPIDDKTYDLVLVKRVLSNLPKIDRPGAIEELQRITKPGGRVVVIDTFREGLENVNKARKQAGLGRLKSPNIPLDEAYMIRTGGFSRTPWGTIAGGYYLWTRLWAPFILGGGFIPYESHELRQACPIPNVEVGGMFAVHQLIYWRRPHG
jgi:SAM-dependent methyltransferase